MPKGKGKKLVYVPEDILEEVAEACRKRGESIGRFVEDALTQAVRVNEMGYDPKRLAEFFEVMQAQRVLGGTFVPLDVFNYMIKRVYREDREQLNAKWYESGGWHGKYLKERFDDPIQAFKSFLEVSRWDLGEVDVEKGGEVVNVRCVSTVLTAEGTELLAKFIEGVMHGMGYKTGKKDVVRGMIVLEFRH
jgi:hypothetical protein